jgi:NADH-quinone oxidoreductase subunit N
MNLGAFAVVALIRNYTGSEDLSACRGLAYRSPFLVVLMGVFLLSLLGIPPLAGFVAKFQVFAALWHAGRDAPTEWLRQVFWALLVIGGLNTAFSAFYYMRVLKTMIFEFPPESADGVAPPALPIPARASGFVAFLAAAVVLLGVVVDPLAVAGEKGASGFEKYRAPAPILKGGPGKDKAGGAKTPGKGKGKTKGKAPPKAPTKTQPPTPPKGDTPPPAPPKGDTLP